MVIKIEKSELYDFFCKIPILVVIVAAFAAFLHIAPYWRAQSQVPPGWKFTGNINASPDVMQYRVWSRRTLDTGILVDNKFTDEPNKPHLPVVFYYIIGRIARMLGIEPEYVNAYVGSIFAFCLTIMIFVIVRHFFSSPYQIWWIFILIMLGGGIGAHLKILAHFDLTKDIFILRRTIVDGLKTWPVFEDYRGSYTFITLFDTHYLLIWLLVITSVLSFYFTIRDFSILRMIMTGILFACTTVFHLYEGVTLISIVIATTYLCWMKKIGRRPTIVTSVFCFISVTTVLVWLYFLYRSSGLPISPWRAKHVAFLTLFISYPIAWIAIAYGAKNIWKEVGLKECFVYGWLLGCIIITLSGPFYPYTDRGTMTLQIPIYVIAGSIYFSDNSRISWRRLLLVIMLLGATPVWMTYKMWLSTSFRPDAPYMFMSKDHLEIVDILKKQAGENDLLLIDKSKEPWKTDDLWLAPEYPGRLYCGHFFLTVDYDRKRREVIRFFESKPEEQSTFLQSNGIRFLYIDDDYRKYSFEQIPGLTLIKTTVFGSLFEYKKN